MAACAVSPNLAKEAGATTAAPVVTCRKMRPKVSPDLWCRSCAMNLKKRCGGLLASPEAPPQPDNSSSICSSGFSHDAFVIDGCPPPKTTSMLIESKNSICNPRGGGGGSSTNNGLPGVSGRKRCAPSSSPGWVTPSPQHRDAPLLRRREVAPRHKKARTLSGKIAGHLKGHTCSRASDVETDDNDDDGASDGVSDGDFGDAADAAEAAAAAAEETWVQCESCATWRQLPRHVNPDDLPDVWFCHMNEWNPAESSCGANVSANKNKSGHSRRRCSAADAALVHKVLGVQSVEQVKELNKARGLRTTRVGSNGGRKSKGELIDDLLDDGLTPADIGAVATTTSAARREASPTLQPDARNTNTNLNNRIGNSKYFNKSNGSNGGKGVANSGNGSRSGYRNGNTSEHGAKKSRLSLVPPHARLAPNDETGDNGGQSSEEEEEEEEEEQHVRVQRRPRSNTCDDLPSPLSAPWPAQRPGHGRPDHHHHHEGEHPSSNSASRGLRNHMDAQVDTDLRAAGGISQNKQRTSLLSGRRERADSWPASSREATRHFESELSGGTGRSSSSSYTSARGGGSSSGGGSTAHVEAWSERRLTADAVADAERFRAYVRSRIRQTPSPVLTSSSSSLSSLAPSPSMAAPSSTTTTTIEAPGAPSHSSSSSSSSFTSTLSFEHGGAAAVHSTAGGGAHPVYATPEAPSSTSSASGSEATAAYSLASSLVSSCPLASLAEVACIALEYPNHTTTSYADAPPLPCPAKISSDSSTPPPSSFSSSSSSSSATTAAVLSASDAVPASSSTSSFSSHAAASSVGVLTPAPLPAVTLPRETPVPLSGAGTRALMPGSAASKATTAVEESSAEELINGAKASFGSGVKDSAEDAAATAASLSMSKARIISIASGASFKAPTEVFSRSPQPMALDECLAMVDRNSRQRAAASGSVVASNGGGRSSKDSSDGSEEYDKGNVLLVSEDQSTSGNEETA